jgi:hypothetical protein
MAARERYHAVIKAESVDRLPCVFGETRTSTFAACRKQDLSAEQEAEWAAFIAEHTYQTLGKLDFGPLPRPQELMRALTNMLQHNEAPQCLRPPATCPGDGRVMAFGPGYASPFGHGDTGRGTDTATGTTSGGRPESRRRGA